MKVQYNGLLRILSRKYRSVYTKDEIARIIEEKGANYIDKNVKYLGFGVWEVSVGNDKI